MPINVSPTTGLDSTHHLALEDADGTTQGLICYNRDGDKTASVATTPFPTFASQLRQGRGKHSDRVPPFEDIAQSDFSGGLAMLHHDEDESKYLDGKRIDTSRAGEVIHGGLETYTTGLRDFDESWPGDVDWVSLYSGGTESKTVSFVAGASYNVNSIVVILKKVGAPTGNITVSLLASNDAVLKSKVLVVGTDLLTDLVSERVEFTFASVQAITATTTYKVKVAYASGSATAYVDVGVDGSTNPYYRVLDDTTAFNALTFELNGGFYLITQPEDRSVSKIYLLGERGVADANTGALTTTIDATKSWTNDEWISGVVKIVGGPGSDEDEPYRTITDNDSTTLTHATWNVEHTTETEYVIMHDKWQLMQTLSYYATDVAVGKNYAVISQSGAGILRYQVRELNGAMDETISSAGALTAEKLAALGGGFGMNERDGGLLFVGQCTSTDYPTVRKRIMPPYADSDIRGLVKKLPMGHEPWDNTSYTNVDNYVSDGLITIEITTAVNGDIAQREIDYPFICTKGRYFEFCIKSVGGQAAGKIQFGYEDKFGDRLNVNLPALVANTWKYVSIEMSEKPSESEGTLNEDKITTYYLKTTESIKDTFYIDPDVGMRLAWHGVGGDLYHLPMNAQINNIVEYIGGAGEIASKAWVLTDKGIYYEEEGYLKKLWLRELAELEHPRNGEGVTVNDVYLYFNLAEMIQRYYSGKLDNIGPDIDYGLPANRRGIPCTMATYAGKVLAGYDAETGTSHVIYRKNHGWHEFYRARAAAERIRNIHVFARADTVDRVYISEGADVLWVPISVNPQTESGYEYTYESVLETSRIYGGLRETEKYYHAVSLVTENLSMTNRYLQVDYKTSENSSWTLLSGNFTTSPRQRRSIVSTNDTDGRWIQFRIRSYTNDRTETPKIISFILDSLEVNPVNDIYAYEVGLKEGLGKDLRGTDEDRTGADAMTQLETWRDDPKPLTLSSQSTFEDGKLVKLENLSKHTRYHKVGSKEQEVRLVTLSLIEVS